MWGVFISGTYYPPVGTNLQVVRLYRYNGEFWIVCLGEVQIFLKSNGDNGWQNKIF